MSFSSDQPRIAIMGAGVGGLMAAIALRRQLGYDNFLIFDKGDEIGGTWRDNTYPGCGSDVGAHWYTLSTDPYPYWSTFFASQPDLQQYWLNLVTKYNLRPKFVKNANVHKAVWDDSAQGYTLFMDVGGVQREVKCEILIGATGGLVTPRYPAELNCDGAFKGPLFHSAKWRHDVSLKGKRVAVIGNGCSGAQLIPQILKDETTTVVNFVKSPHWLVPRYNIKYSKTIQWIFANVPFAMTLYRAYLASVYDVRFMAFQNRTSFINEKTRKLLTMYMKHKAPAKYHDFLIPTYPPGCKRMIIDPGYLKALHQPNMELNMDGIEQIVPEGILTKKGEVLPFDVIILATGFDNTDIQVDLRGKGGITLSEYAEQHGGPIAYLGSCVPAFPNYFWLLGPNTATGHASVIFSEEVQINYAIQMIRPLLHRSITSFSVKESACEKYNDDLEKRLNNTVFTECMSWYRVGHKGRNISIFPGPLMLFWWWCRNVKWSDYEVVKGKGNTLQNFGGPNTLVGMGKVMFASFVLAALGWYVKGS